MDNTQKENNPNDFSWLEGKWFLSLGNSESYSITFKANGMTYGSYCATYVGYYDTVSEYGNYSVINGRKIQLDSNDGYPSYFYIEGNRITDGQGKYFIRK